MKHVLMIGGRDHTIRKFEQLNISYSIIQSPDLVTELQQTTAKKLIVMDYKKHDEVLILVKALHQIEHYDAILSFAEYGLISAAICSKELGLPSNDIFPIEHTRDKLKMRELLDLKQLATVKYKLCNDIEDVKEFFGEINNPIIVKPANSAGSKGVALIKNVEDIQSAWSWACDAKSMPIIAEEYIEGDEFSVETISLDGRHEIAVITEKLTTSAPHFIELGHHAPARLNKEMKNKVEEMVLNFLDAIKQKTGPTHTEIKVYGDEVKIIESQTRIGGDQIWEMTEIVSGIDQMSETICHLLNLPMPKRNKQANAAAIQFIAKENITIKNIKNLETAKQLANILRVKCDAKIGDELGVLKSSSSRQGYILATGDSVESAIGAAQRAINTIVLE